MKQERVRSKDSSKKAQQRVNPWLIHVKKVKEQNKKMAYKDVLKEAKKTYKSKAKPKEKPKAEPKKKQPSSNIIEKFKNNMKKLIDIIYHPNVYEYSDPNRVDDEERDKALTIKHKKDLFIDFKSFTMDELY